MKNVLVTGVSRGIGREIAKQLHSEGYNIFGVYKYSKEYTDEKSEGDSLKDELKNLVLIPCDLADQRSYEQIQSVIGNTKLDAVVNNAAEFYMEKWQDLNKDNWQRTIDVNLSAPLWLVHTLDSNLANNASIVNIVSTDAFVGAYETRAYGVAKAGLVQATKSLACVLGDRRIRVNAVAPGWVETPMTEGTLPDESTYMTPLGRNAKPSEIADVVRYLLSEKASFINGAVINSDGGLTAVDYTLKKEANL